VPTSSPQLFSQRKGTQGAEKLHGLHSTCSTPLLLFELARVLLERSWPHPFLYPQTVPVLGRRRVFFGYGLYIQRDPLPLLSLAPEVGVPAPGAGGGGGAGGVEASGEPRPSSSCHYLRRTWTTPQQLLQRLIQCEGSFYDASFNQCDAHRNQLLEVCTHKKKRPPPHALGVRETAAYGIFTPSSAAPQLKEVG
jgi:hypothetical protein